MTLHALAGSSALAFVLSASTLWAAVTPEQVWQGWQDATAAMGNKVSADSATRNGDTLVIQNVTIGDAEQGMATIGTISLKDNGDGTVSVVLPDSYPVKISVPPTGSDTEATELSFDVSMPAAKIVASGTPDTINYQTDAADVDLKLISVKGVRAEALKVAAEARLAGLSTTYVVKSGDAKSFTEDLKLKSANISGHGADPVSKSGIDLTVSMADLASTVAVTKPKDMDMNDLAKALEQGFNMEGSFSFGATTFDVNAMDAGKPTQITGSTGSALISLKMDGTKFDYGTDTKTVSLTVVSPDIPLPDASLSYGQAAFHLLTPVAKSDTPADFALSVNIVDLAPSESIWALIDPTKALKHDPATLVIDATGKATLTRDLMADAVALEGGDTAPPGQVNALEVKSINLKAAGAEVTSQGAFTFDNSDMTTFDGVPLPTGKIDIKATGVNALIDTLVKMGVVPKDQAMQGRMMLAMFANTSTTADEMTSTLEFKDKHFFANGQQLQ